MKYEIEPPPAMELRDRRTAFVLDASALLAMLREEPGAEMVELVLEHAVMSTVNWSEVVQKARFYGVKTAGMRAEVEALGLEIQPFTADDAESAASLWQHTKSSGLSLGDRACLATGERLGLPVLTTDRAWKDLEAGVGITVELLRG